MAQHKLTRLSKSILSEPQLITVAKFDEIASYLESRNNGTYQESLATSESNSSGSNKEEVLAETTVGVLRVDGPLTYRPVMDPMCGGEVGTSYQNLLNQTDELLAMDNVNTILMLVDSPGGQAYSLFSTARAIRDKVDKAGKRLVAFVDGISASAGFGLTSVAHEVIAHPDAQVGSIGVVIRLVNATKAEEKAGFETTYITAGDSKVPFDKEGNFRKEFKADLQDSVDELYTDFINHVAETRSISPETVRGTEAKMFSSKRALELGLIDKVMEQEEFYTYLADTSATQDIASLKETNSETIKLEDTSPSKQIQNPSTEEISMSDTKTEASVDAALAKMQASLDKQTEMNQAQAAIIEAFQADKAKAELSALTASLDKYSFLADSKDSVAAFLSDSQVGDVHKSLMNTILGNAQASYEKVEAEAVSKIADAELKTEAAETATIEAVAAKDAIKEEFGVKENLSTETPVDTELSHEESIAAAVTLRKAELAAKKSK